MIELLVSQALLCDAQENRKEALMTLEHAVTVAWSSRFIRVFIELGPRIASCCANSPTEVWR